MYCSCGMIFCYDCGYAWHENEECQQVIDRVFKGYSKSHTVLKCPSCSSLCEKRDGCNHMTCPICRYQWCWLCKQQYRPGHYNRMNPLGCPGLMYNHRQAWPKWKIYLRRFCHLIGIILLLVLLPAILIFMVAATYAFVYLRRYRHKHSLCRRSIVIVLLFCMNIVLFPLTLLLYVLRGIYMLYLRVRQWLRRRARTERIRLIILRRQRNL